MLEPEFEDNQLGTVHYHYLTNTAGGLLIVGKGWDEHLHKLNDTLSRPRQDVVKPFIKAFVRPHGLDVAATPMFVEQVEAMQQLVVQPEVSEAFGFVWRWAIARVRAMRHNQRYDRWILSEREQTVKQRNEDYRQRKARERRDAREALTAAPQQEQEPQALADQK